jgi:hypothetical protein
MVFVYLEVADVRVLNDGIIYGELATVRRSESSSHVQQLLEKVYGLIDRMTGVWWDVELEQVNQATFAFL